LSRALSHELLGYWTRFAKTGDPNGDGAPRWEPYESARDNYLELDTTIAARAGLHSEACDLMDRLAK
jgi:para-nitrobenzyl esterase